MNLWGILVMVYVFIVYCIETPYLWARCLIGVPKRYPDWPKTGQCMWCEGKWRHRNDRK